MPGCSQCGKQWPDGFSRCPDDGAMLIGAHSVRTAATSAGAALAYAPSNDEDLPPGSLAGEYRIEKKIGEGGMGAVYGAKHPLIGKRAAIKVIRRELSSSREAVDRFVLEAQSVNQIGHPNIVDVFGFGHLPDGRSFFVMEWLEGESLRERLQRPLQFPDALEMLEQIARALEAAHDAGVVHRDLKPDNVFLTSRKGEKSKVKLLDFGLAKLTGPAEGAAQFTQTRTGVVMGTPMYLSPEQAKGGKIDASTDVYSLGAMAYEMLSGVVPFKADSAVEIMAMHISSHAVPLIDLAPWVPPEINALVLQMLEKDPRNRPLTREVAERIAACRSRASVATIGMQINPSVGAPAYTPQGSMRTPMPHQSTPMGQQYTPQGHQMTPSPHMMTPGYGSQPPQSGMSYAAPASGGKRTGLIIGGVLVAAAVVAGIVVVTSGKKSSAPTEQVATQPAVAPTPAPPVVDPTPAPPVVDPTPTPGAGSGSADSAEGSGSAEGSAAGSGSAVVENAGSAAPAEDPVKDPGKKDPIKRPDPPRRGRVTVVFEGPPKAMILVDGKPQGRETGGRVTLDLSPGEHTVRVQAKGYKPGDAKVRVEAGGSREIKVVLQKRSSVNNVHDPFAD